MSWATAVFAVLCSLLASASAQTNTTQYSSADIGDYQVALWTAILLVAILLGTVYFMLGMDERKDPQLYAQIIDARASKQGAAR